MKRILFFSLIFISLFCSPIFSQQRIKKAVFQAFWWNYSNNNFPHGWSNYLCELAPRLKAAGFDAVWIPPNVKNAAPNYVGYAPFDNYDLGDKAQKGYYDSASNAVYTASGTKDELLRMIAVMHANGIEVIEDVVMGHMSDAGSRKGNGGQDTYANTNYSDGSTNGYKNFRYTCYATPAIDESANDYWSRSGRWSKNWENFYPNQYNNSYNTTAYNTIMFGPQISFESNAYGTSTSMTDGTSVTIGSVTRNLYNPAQTSNYMYQGTKDWLAWYKKQTGADGWRWDAAKNMYGYVVKDATMNSKYNASFANGGQNMFCVTEYVDSKSALDTYVASIENNNDIIAGTFDFNLRAFDANGGIYGMVAGMGNYNMQNLPAAQQNLRYYNYSDGTRVHRTTTFVNNHDTFRPILDANGNYSQALGISSGWDNGNELSPHIDPREPRLAAAYAAICAMDGNPTFFIEDMFDLGTTNKRYSHLPTNTTDLPIRGDIQNVLQAHQKLGFKNGDYQVPTSLQNQYSPYYQSGSSVDHLVLERTNIALIGITDAYSTVSDNSADQKVWISTSFPIGTILYDYSGAHGLTTSQVYDNAGDVTNHRVLISTAPNGHTILGAYGHGYSIWAPYPGTPTSVNDLYNYLATYVPLRSTSTTQEWEMADDLGDSHCNSLGQGGALPSNSTNQRVAGKIFVAANSTIIYKIYPQTDNTNITAALWDLDGNKLNEIVGSTTAASPLTGTYTALSDEWLTVKVHNTTNTQAGQKCWVNVTYTAPAVVNTRSSVNAAATRAAIWTGNSGTTDITDCGNWEEGILPSSSVNLVVPSNAKPFPVITHNISVKNVIINANDTLSVNNNAVMSVSGSITNNGNIIVTPGASFISSSPAANITLQQNIVAQRGWRVFANPFTTLTDLNNIASVNNITINTSALASGLTDVRLYDNVADAWNNISGTNIPSNTPYALFIRGLAGEVTGLNYSGGPSSFTFNVSGTLNSNSVTVLPSVANHFMLVGNPFAAPVSSSALTNGVGIPYYVYTILQGTDQTTQRTKAGSWAAVMSSSASNVLPALGSIIYSPANTTGYNISPSDINASGNIQTSLFGGSNTIPLSYLELQTESNGNYQDKLFIRLDNTATAKSNDKIDLAKLANDNVNVYTIAPDNAHLAVDARNSFDSVPLGIKAANANYTFKVANNSLPDGITAYLLDKLQNTQTELVNGAAYNFSVTSDSTSSGEKRFVLRFDNNKTTVTKDNSSTKKFNATILGNVVNNSKVVVQISGGKNPMIKVIDMNGKIVNTLPAVNGINQVNINNAGAGLILLQIIDGNNIIVKKVVKP